MGLSKKGALVVYVLIPLLLALAGFIIVLYFLGMLDFSGYAEDEICELSILTRATAPAAAQNFVPLKCTTKKICLTKKLFGECSDFAGEKDVERVRLPNKAEDAARKIEEVNANAKYDCWKRTKQGKLDLTGNFWTELGLSQGQSTCIICSRIAIDKDSFSGEELAETLKQVNINNYMETHNVPGSEKTYVQIFTNSGASRLTAVEESDTAMKTALGNNFEENKKSLPNGEYIKENYEKLEKGDLERAYVFSQVKQPSLSGAFEGLGNIGMSLALGAGMTPVISRVAFHPYVLIPGLVVAAGVAGYATYNNYVGSEAVGMYCGKFQSSVVDKDQEGCSLVQGIPYDVKYVNSICQNVQGNP